MGFSKAKAQQAFIKYGIYAGSGRGKTLTALLMAEHLANGMGKRVAVVETEHGTDFYCKKNPHRLVHPEEFDFDAMYTRSLTEVLAELRKFDTAKYGVLIVDSITHLWETAKASYTGRKASDGKLPFHAWDQIKRPYREMMELLLALPVHVIICGREGNDFRENEEGKLESVGKKMKAEGETKYEPHVMIHLETVREKDGKEQVFAYAEKDRTSVLAGRWIPLWPAPEGQGADWTVRALLLPVLPLLGVEQAPLMSSDAAAAADRAVLESERKKSEAFAKGVLAKIDAESDVERLAEMRAKLTHRHWDKMGEYAEQVTAAFAEKLGDYDNELARLAAEEEGE